jgi:hypothetical protein
MLLASTVRGVDGTGIVAGNLDIREPATYMKGVPCAGDFIDKGDMYSLADRARWIITHTRAATLGGVKQEACHPFSEGPVVGVHNGTVHTIKRIFPNLEGVNDSQIIYKALAEAEPDEASDVLDKLFSGAYALAWYDNRLSALRFARNHDRPLWFHKEGNYWFWASEPGMIAAAIARHSRDPLGYKKITPWQMKTYNLLTIPVDGSEATVENYRRAYSTYSPGASSRPFPYDDPYTTGYENGYDAWSQWGYQGNDHRQRRMDLPKADAPDGWLSIAAPDDVWHGPMWLQGIRLKILKRVKDLLGGLPKNKENEGIFKSYLIGLARKTGTTDGTATIAVPAQVVTMETGMMYGSVQVDGKGEVPVVGRIPDDELVKYREEALKCPLVDAYPRFTGTIDSLKAYSTGEIGISIDDVKFDGWCGIEAVSFAARQVGGGNEHPHLDERNIESGVSWKAWNAVVV